MVVEIDFRRAKSSLSAHSSRSATDSRRWFPPIDDVINSKDNIGQFSSPHFILQSAEFVSKSFFLVLSAFHLSPQAKKMLKLVSKMKKPLQLKQLSTIT